MVVVVWFTAGGVRDLIRMVRLLRARAINVRDDGTVIDGVNADEIEPTQSMRQRNAID